MHNFIVSGFLQALTPLLLNQFRFEMSISINVYRGIGWTYFEEEL
jgi:hypothetical protein